MSAPLKAYLVDADQEQGAQLYFAETPGKAKAQCANDEGIDFVDIISCVRKPEFDEYAPGPVPIKVLIEAGWWFECHGCYRRVDDEIGDEYDDYEEEQLDGPIYRGNNVWCSTRCQEADDLKLAEEKRLQEIGKAAVLAKWPEATDVKAAHYDGSRFHFRFGGKYEAAWTVGDEFVGVTPADVEVWNAFRERQKELTHGGEAPEVTNGR